MSLKELKNITKEYLQAHFFYTFLSFSSHFKIEI